MEENEIGSIVVAAALALHRELGPGLLESVYEVVLAHLLRERELRVERQVPISITYRDLVFEEAFRADLIVERKLLIEIKCVELLTYAHKKQLLTYLRLTQRRLGYLINFNAPLLKSGVIRVVNRLEG
jgi:GxxExxY protein